MAGLAVAIPAEQWAGNLSATAAALRRPLGPLLKVLQTAVVADAKLNFDRSADPDGRPWKPLKFPRARGGNKPLRDTGLLLASLSGGAHSLNRVSGNGLVVGTNRAGARLHQFGGTVTPKRGKFLAIPATREAARSGPRDFRRPLSPRIGAKGGVLVEKRDDTVQYYLTRRVVVPARSFLGAGKRLLDKLAQLTADYLARPLAGGRP